MKSRLLFCSFVLVMGLSAMAKDYVYTGLAPTPPPAERTQWSDGQNWSPNGVPGPGDTATIGAEFTNGYVSGFTVNLTAPVTVENLTLVGSTLTGGSLKVMGTLEVKVSVLANSELLILGTMNVDPGSRVAGGETDISSDVYNYGTVNLNSSALLRLYNAGKSFISYVKFNMANGSTLDCAVSGVKFDTTGTFTAGNATVSGFGGSSVFVNYGTVDVESGTLQLMGSGSAAGYVNNGIFKAGANGSINVQGASTLHDGASFTGAGATTLGNVTADGLVTVNGNVSFVGGSWIETGTLEIASGGVFTWQGGNIASFTPGSTSLVKVDLDGGLILDSGGGYLQLLQTVIDNHGYIAWTNGGSFLLGNNAVITNETDGYFDAQCDGVLGATSAGGSSSATFQNLGNFLKSAGATNNFTAIALPFNCVDSRVDVSAGTLKFSRGGEFRGEVVIKAYSPGRVEFSFGTYSIHNFMGPSIRFSGNGKMIADGAVLLVPEFNYARIEGDFELSAGYIGGLGDLAIYGTLTWSGGTMADAGLTVNHGRLNISGINVNLIDRSLINSDGTITWSSVGNILCSQTSGNTNQVIDNQAGGTFDIQYDAQINGSPTFKNEGLLKKTGAGGTTSLICNVINTGTIEVDSGILEMRSQYTDKATGPQAANGKTVLKGGTIKYDSSQSLFGDVTGSGTIQAPKGLINYGDLEPDVVQIYGDLGNQSDQHLGHAPGVTTIHGNFSQGAAATLFSDLRGTNAAAPDFGQLLVTGSAALAGKLTVSIENGYAPAPGAQFQILSAASRSGTFDTLNVPAGISVNYSNTGVFLMVTGAVPVQILPPQVSAGNFNFGFYTISNRSYTVQSTTNLTNPNWILFTHFTGNGSLMQLAASVTNAAQRFFRVSEP